MKKSLIAFAAFASTLCQCSEEEITKTETVQFSIQIPAESPGKINGSLPVGSMLLISITDEQGMPLHTLTTLPLLEFNDNYVTEPLQLTPGKYVVTDLLIVDAVSRIRYVTPKRRSKYSSLVLHSLPYVFHVSKNNVSNIPMEVIQVDGVTAEEIGYVSFDIEPVLPWQLSVFAPVNDQLTLTHADGILQLDGETITTFPLDAKVNLLGFRGKPGLEYELVIRKKGFKTSIVPFNYDELFSGNNFPMEIILEPEKSFSFEPQKDVQVWFTFRGTGSITIDWGNGTEEIIPYSPLEGKETSYYYREQFYPGDEIGLVTITGDVHNLTELVSITDLGNLKTNDLIGLENLTLENNNVAHLDLSACNSLKNISFINTSIDRITLPDDHELNSVFIEGSGTGWDSAFLLAGIIQKVYKNAFQKKIREGAFILLNAGEVPGESLVLLNELEQNLDWYIGID